MGTLAVEILFKIVDSRHGHNSLFSLFSYQDSPEHASSLVLTHRHISLLYAMFQCLQIVTFHLYIIICDEYRDVSVVYVMSYFLHTVTLSGRM